MKFTFIQETRNASGAVEQLTSQFEQDDLVIGRGGSADVVLSSRKLSLEHARFSFEGGTLFISDLGSLAGVKHNGSIAKKAAVSSGDEVVLGDVSLTVEIEGSDVRILCRVSDEVPQKEEDVVREQSRRLQVSSYLPSMFAINVAVAVVALAVWFVYPFTTASFESWNSGPISNAHKTIEKDCQRCHAQPFQQVQDQQCLNCHNMAEHAEGADKLAHKHPQFAMRCAECHMEHNGDHALIQHDARQCVSCHASMKDLKADAKVQNVADLATHPQFRITVPSADGTTTTEVSLDDKAQAVDASTLKLNHALHLKAGLRGKDGPVTLQCNACHELDKDFKSIKPISFERHCRDCHSLEFEERLPGVQVPHGDSEAVYPALFVEYTKLLMLGSGKGTDSQAARLLPDSQTVDKKPMGPADVKTVQAAARNAEKELFTKTGCFLCHNFKEKPSEERSSTTSNYDVTKPNVPAVWFTAARFDHGAHEEVSCESCHEKTRKSSKTSDVLLPGVALCKDCHSQEPKSGHVTSGCVECHSYHDQLPFPREKKQELADYVKSVMR